MNITIVKLLSQDNKKEYYTLQWGRNANERKATGVFTYVRPINQLQKNHNKEALAILETKRSQMIFDAQSIGSSYFPQHKIKANFLDYYQNYIKENRTAGNRHLETSLSAFKAFLKKDFISASDITENLCKTFRDYLVKKFNGETPANYFMRFKRVLRAAKKDGYFRESSAEDIVAKTNKNKQIKEVLSEEEYESLMNTPCTNYEVKKAIVFSLYTGLRWADVKPLQWENIKSTSIVLNQKKTGIALEVPLHEIATQLSGERKDGIVFHLPTQDGANKVLRKWALDAGLNKHITWHCARHSFSVLLQQKGVDLATVAGMLGHTTTKYVQQTYKRYLQSSSKEAIKKLPSPV
jgi:integrase/recombinase XerD